LGHDEHRSQWRIRVHRSGARSGSEGAGRSRAPFAAARALGAFSIDREALEGLDAVVHLAGENVAGARWSDAQKQRIRESRVRGTRLLAEALSALRTKPAVWLSASAVGIYGDGGDRPLDEDSPPGDDFLAQVGVAWEEAAAPARAAGIRVVHPRFGVVLHPSGGALAKMLGPFKLGLGGKLGSGAQYMSWIALEDAVRALLHLIDQPLEGPVNLVAPNPVTNAEFTRALARALHRPAPFFVPSFAARLALGEMAEVALLRGQRVFPKRLLASGFRFAQPELEPLLSSFFAPAQDRASASL
jgi:uncharacterized protein (TIGR01777 family)